MESRAAIVAFGVLLAGCGHANGVVVPGSPAGGWTLSWSDEFDGPAGASVDGTRWTFDIGGGGFGNNELETYTERNARLDGNGVLVIDVKREAHTGPDGIARDYTSARIKTQDRFTQAYGRVEARLKIPRGQGIWPAFWMLGADIATVGWPACGEIDIMENIGKEKHLTHATVHGPGYSGASGIGAAFTFPADVADDFHVFAVEWEPAALRFFVDGRPFETITPARLPAGARWVFDHPFFVILNVAVGGNWPGPPDDTTVLPQQMLVDYVRVYRQR